MFDNEKINEGFINKIIKTSATLLF
jgi:hypothetical protein